MDMHNIKIYIVTLVTLFAVSLFVGVGLTLRRYVAAEKSNRPFSEDLFTRIFRKTRLFQIAQFCCLADAIIKDTQEMVSVGQDNDEARAIVPILAEIRKKGQDLLAKRGFIYTFIPFSQERKLDNLLTKLMLLEKRLRALPRSILTIDDVLAGNFEKTKLVNRKVQHV